MHDGGEDAGMLMYVDPMDQSMVNLELLAVPEGLELDFKPFLAERERERERGRNKNYYKCSSSCTKAYRKCFHLIGCQLSYYNVLSCLF